MSEAATRKLDDATRQEVVMRLVRERWINAGLGALGIGLLLAAVLLLLPGSLSILLRQGAEFDPDEYFAFWSGQDDFREAVRTVLINSVTPLIAIVALPAIASRASRDERTYAHVESQMGWQIMAAVSFVLVTVSWLSLPFDGKEWKDLDNWAGLLTMALGIVIHLVTGPTYFQGRASVEEAKRAEQAVKKVLIEAREFSRKFEEEGRVRRLSSRKPIVGFVVGSSVWVVFALILSETSAWYVLAGYLIALVLLPIGRFVVRLRLYLEPIALRSGLSCVIQVSQIIMLLYLGMLWLTVFWSAFPGWWSLALAALPIVWGVGGFALVSRQVVQKPVCERMSRLCKVKDRRVVKRQIFEMAQDS